MVENFDINLVSVPKIMQIIKVYNIRIVINSKQHKICSN